MHVCQQTLTQYGMKSGVGSMGNAGRAAEVAAVAAVVQGMLHLSLRAQSLPVTIKVAGQPVTASTHS